MSKANLKPNIGTSPHISDERKEQAALTDRHLMTPQLDGTEQMTLNQEGEVIEEAVWLPASLPMTSTDFFPAKRVKSLKTMRHPKQVQKGDTFYCHAVYQNGSILISRSDDPMAEALGLYPMAQFVELLKQRRQHIW